MRMQSNIVSRDNFWWRSDVTIEAPSLILGVKMAAHVRVVVGQIKCLKKSCKLVGMIFIDFFVIYVC